MKQVDLNGTELRFPEKNTEDSKDMSYPCVGDCVTGCNTGWGCLAACVTCTNFGCTSECQLCANWSCAPLCTSSEK